MFDASWRDAPDEKAGVGALNEISEQALEDQIVDLAARIASATCRWLGLVAEYDRREAWLGSGMHSCASWLAWRCSIAPRSAREHVRVARALEALPLTRERMARGDLSYSKVRVLTRIATPELEAELVELALQATAAQLERVARGYRVALRVEDAERIHAERYLSYHWEQDGSLSISGSLPAEDGAALLKALEMGREEMRDSEDGRRAINADALVLMAESLLARGAAGRAAAERAQVVVHVDAAALAAEETIEGEPHGGPVRCCVEDGGNVSPETARRLSCDAAHVRIVEGPSGPLDVGRRTRTVPAPMRRALQSRDGGCRFPGCTHRRWTDSHHIRHWSQGGETSVENLVLLCRRHHQLVHEGGFRVDRSPEGELRFWSPRGTLIEQAPAPRSRRHGGRRRLGSLPPVGGTPVPRSAGDRMDFDLAVVTLAGKATRSAQGP
jgi:hypothetical protein